MARVPQPLAPKLPLRIGGSATGGYVSIVYHETLVKQNLKNLLLTVPGEKTGDLNFGVGLRRYLFLQNTEETSDSIKTRIYEQVARYMPYVNIAGVVIIRGDDAAQEAGTNPNLLTIKLYYNIKSTLGTVQSDEVVISVQLPMP